MGIFRYTVLRNGARVLQKLRLGRITDGWDAAFCTRGPAKTVRAGIASLLHTDLLSTDILSDEKRVPDWCIGQYLSHRFDLLGSGWTDLNRAPGNAPALGAYREIDWQRDYRSTYRFDCRQTGRAILRAGIPNGVEIKAPWELARLYHLPQLALAARTGAGGKRLYTEYRNQVVDFIDNNPVGYGANWICAMEVGIRAANILLAHDLFAGVRPVREDDAFERRLVRSLLEHGRFILLNLEKTRNADANGNHYLSDLCGLLFISSYIVTKETAAWKRFASKELLIELDAQFFSDGGSAEASTAYHRLSAELMAYSIALLLRNGVNIPQPLQDKLCRVAEFMRAVTKTDGDIVQLGDNDSGHLFRLTVSGAFGNTRRAWAGGQSPAEAQFDADEIWAGRTADALMSMLACDVPASTEVSVLNALTEGRKLSTQSERKPETEAPAPLEEADLPYVETRQYPFSMPLELSTLRHMVFEAFGLAVYTGPDFRLYVRLPVSCALTRRSHLHDDAFHWECEYHGTVGFADPGSYLYTSDKAQRMLYRSNRAHHVPVHEAPLVKLNGLWDAKIRYQSSAFTCGDAQVTLTVQAGAMVHTRILTIERTGIRITDKSNESFCCNDVPNVCFSAGYGKRP